MLKNIDISKIIYCVRKKYVILDCDLAKLFEYERAKDINRIVKHNISMFSINNYFQLTIEEYKKISIQNASLEREYKLFGLYIPCVFTEEAVLKLATLLKSSISRDVVGNLIDAFIKMKHYLMCNLNILNDFIVNNSSINNSILNISNNLFNEFDKLNCEVAIEYAYYNSNIYEYKYILYNIIHTSKESIVIIDNNIEEYYFELLDGLNSKIKIVTSKNNNLRFNKLCEFKNKNESLELEYNKIFTSKYMLIDNTRLYLINPATSYKGCKCNEIVQLKERDIINAIRSKLY